MARDPEAHELARRSFELVARGERLLIHLEGHTGVLQELVDSLREEAVDDAAGNSESVHNDNERSQGGET